MRLFSSSTFSLSSLCSSSPPRALLLHFSQFSASFSSSNYSFPSSSSSRRHDEESRYVRVSVWWDFENCNIPAGVNVFKVAHLITAAVRANGIKGPVQILLTAFRTTFLQLSSQPEALRVHYYEISRLPLACLKKTCSLAKGEYEYLYPSIIMFLRDFASILHRLRMNNYNVLLASPESAPGVLCSAASIMWHWNALVKGENLVGRHFNQPPDGPYGSWYGHYKVPLEDPFPVNEQASSIRSEEVSEISSDPKPLPIPRAVIREIRYILKLYPKGISITDLRSELGKSKISIDRDYYGYKKFSRFLLSMPHTLKLQTNGDGQLIVRIVTPRTIEPFESSRGTSDNGTEEQDRNLIAKLNNNGSSPESTSVPLVRSSELNAQDRPEKVQPSYELVKSTGEAMGGEPSTWPVSEPHVMEDSKQTSKFEADNNMIPSIGQHSEAKTGFFRRIWRRFVVGSKDHNSENGSHHISEKCSTSDDASKQKSCGHVTNYSNQNLGEAKSEGKTVKPMSEDANSVHPVSNSPDREPAKLQKTAVVASAYDDKSRSRPGVLSSIRNWFKIRENDTETGKESEQCCEQNQLKNECGKHQLFSSSSFWQDMQSFIETPKGVELILQSKTRSEMAQKLLEEGPLVLKSLSTSELFDFIESLISDKKWLVECPSETNPFKVTNLLITAGEHNRALVRITPGIVQGYWGRFVNIHEHHLDSIAKNEAITGSFARKQRHQKSYSFVLDTDENDKEKLIDGILGTLKKSSESRVHD
ncbi:hypothetical protein SDJN02_02032, partial [Cucurbita argyrosperma subsp. argyrosperma]